MKKFLPSLLIAVAILSCEEVSDQGLNPKDEVLLVVDGKLTSERVRQEIKLSLTFDGLNDEAPPVTDALVVINDERTNFFLSHDDTRPGVYQTDTLQALFDVLYTLYILHEGNEYFAFATSAIGTPLPPLTVNEIDTGLFEYVHSETIPSMTEVRVTWDENDALGVPSTQEVEAFFYTLNVIDITKTFAPDKELLTFPEGAVVHRRKFSLTEGHQNFLRSFLAEVDWRGGGFDVAAGNVLTNLSEGAVGYFSVSMVVSDSIVVN